MALKHHNDIGNNAGPYGEVSDYYTTKLIIKIKCVNHEAVIHICSYWNNMKIRTSLSASDSTGQRTMKDYCLQGCDAAKFGRQALIYMTSYPRRQKSPMTIIIGTSNLTEIL
jgi:hypothetical protein